MTERLIAPARWTRVDPPRFLADEMVGRLARYLRFVGCDTVYVKGLDDDEIAELARTERRILVTRDQALADRVPSSILLRSPSLADQWNALRAAVPELPSEVRFDRCTHCNGSLRPHRPAPEDPRPDGVPWDRVKEGLVLYRCSDCGHLYWEGTHTEHIRTQIRAWGGAPVP